MTTVADAERSLELAAEARAAFDIDGVVAHLSSAMRVLTAVGDVRRAAMVCVALGDALANGMGNLTAGRAWFARANAMLADEPPCLEQGWAAVAAMGCDVGDPDELLACAELALDRARRFGDVNLETKALADGGLAHVQAGRVEQGMAMLDEAMALVCGPADDEDAAGKSACSFFTACYYSADFERAASWADLLRAKGLIGAAPVTPIFLSSHCATVQACLLCELGRWGEAEALLEQASEEFTAITGMPGFHPVVLLADLRIRQGRLHEAEVMLLGKGQAFEALLPLARLHLARGDHRLAAAAARRGLRSLGPDHLRAIELLAVLVDAELAEGDAAAAAAACSELSGRLTVVGNPVLSARAAGARARVLAAAGDLAGAVELLEGVLGELPAGRAPYQQARLHLELARHRSAAGDGSGAQLDARAAADVLDELDVVIAPDDRRLLDALVATPAPEPVGFALVDHGGWYELVAGETRVRVPSTKGLRYLAELVRGPGTERHVLDLVDRVEGVAAGGEIDRRAIGDAGEVLDHTARDAYRRRIEQLRAECDDLLDAGDLDGAEARQAELDQLVAQLAAAFGIGGRERRASSTVEKARLNVTRALRTAIRRIEEVIPEGGVLLDRAVRTGTYCTYEPGAGEPRWIVQPGVNGTAPV
ncbi:MAG TPA: hypothetical protein VLR27_11210 [Acidimicrobiales bacterium]|nr:hypothetical protein [Acidimicrobiales bacterium]